jgi:tetratricopeptide (TPR) repeat protein
MKEIGAGLLAATLAASLRCLGQSEPTRDDPIAQGVAFHDKGDYEGAIRKYREALKSAPSDAHALYELAFTLSAMKDLKGAVDAAAKGLSVQSRYRPALFTLLGSCRDAMGDSKGAIEAYQQGISEQPRLPLLHYNLGVTYVALERWTDARRSLERAVALKPDHASSHMALARVYESEGYTIPAILANARFLFLEPNSRRSAGAVGELDGLFRRGFEAEKNGDAKITIDPNSKTDEGDFQAVELAALIGQASSHMDEQGSKKKEPELSVERMASEIALIAGSVPTVGGFAAEYYAPFLVALHQQGFDTVFAYYTYQSAGPEVREWLGKHEPEVTKLKQWASGFRWPENVPTAPGP